MARIHRRSTKKGLNNPDKHDGVVTHLEPDILKCDNKWILRSIATKKGSTGDRIPLSYFKF